MNKEQKIASVSTSDNPPSRVQFTTTIGATQEEQKKPQEDLLSDCCHAAFNPMGFERADGLWQEKCLQCGKPCEPIWTQKPQEECFCDYHEKIKRGLCPNMPDVHIRKEKPEEKSWEEDFDSRYALAKISYLMKESVKQYISSNFIAKRDLRKLLEEKEIEYGKREIIDDILAEIEKL